MLGLGMAFISKPRLLMIDELSLGLAPTIVSQLVDIVRAIHAQGTTIILVEQSVNVALTLAERAVFMEKGEVRFSGPTADLLERDDILRSVFLEGAASHTAPGTSPAVAKAPADTIIGKPGPETFDHAPIRLELNGVSKRFGGITAVDDVTLKLREGEVLGLIGPNGAGKTTLFDLISGFTPIDRGTIGFEGRAVSEWSADRRAMAGLGPLLPGRPDLPVADRRRRTSPSDSSATSTCAIHSPRRWRCPRSPKPKRTWRGRCTTSSSC